jgi:diguanylate cyclase (GGDEF)-like protein
VRETRGARAAAAVAATLIGCAEVAGARAPDPTSASASLPAAGEPAFEGIGSARGLTSGSIQAVLVDRHGFTWFAGDGGVHRYDGEHVHTFERDPERSDTLVSRANSALAETADAVWILSFGAVLQRLDATSGAISHFLLVPAPDGKRPARGTGMVADAFGRLWVGTDIGLFRHDPASGNTLAIALGETPARITAIDVDPDGRRLFVGTLDGAIFVLDTATSAVARLAPTATPEPRVALSFATLRGQLWVGTNGGLFHRDAGSGALVADGVPAELRRGRIDAIVAGGDGALWIAGRNRLGLSRLDPESGGLVTFHHHPDDPNSLPSDRIAVLAIDEHQDLWLGLQRDGASRLNVAQQGAGLYRAPIERGNSFCAEQDLPDGRLAVSLCAGGLGVLDPRTGELEDRRGDVDPALPFPVPTLTAHALVPDGDGGFWVPGANVGLLHWMPARRAAVRVPLVRHDGGPLGDPYMNDAVLDGSGRLWVACSIGLASLGPGATVARLVDPASEVGRMLTGGVLALREAGRGRLWLGTSQGLVLYDPASGRAQRYVHDAGDDRSLSDSFVYVLLVDPDGTLWAGTQAGLNRAPATDGTPRFRRYGVGDGLPDQTIDTLVRDATGSLWVGTNRGVARLDPARERFTALSPMDGVPDGTVNWRSGHLAGDGSLYFGTVAGLLRLLPARLRAASPRPVLLESYELDGKSRLNLQGPAVPPLVTSYAAPRARFVVAAFGGQRGLSYRLAGLERDWRPMPPTLAVAYEALPPGRYRFEVRQLGRDDAWRAPELTVPLTVTPPPWRTGIAYALYALTVTVALALASSAYRQRRRLERDHLGELEHLVNFDGLTGLPNRTKFTADLAVAVERAAESPLALLFIDLDRFKNINDSLGHQFGDRVLVAAGHRLRDALPSGARLARLGGDEFTVILPDPRDEAAAAHVAQGLLDSFAAPLVVDGSNVVVTLSIGISLYPTHTREPDALARYADVAVYHAKDSGRNAYRFFAPEMTARVTRRLALETSLREAVGKGELYPVFQPKVDLVGGRLCGAEVLLRWHNSTHGLVPPVEFIPILEDTGLIEAVGLWLIEAVCRQVQAWRAAGLPPISFAVNVSVQQLLRGELAARLPELLAEAALPASALELEVTETALMENAERMAAVLREMRALEIGLAIDDFGTGYSSFASLSLLPVDKLKIDKVFVDGVGRDEGADTLCAAIIAMAHNLRLVVVAEGVETELQSERLRAMGCDEAQGYWYGRPMPAPDFERLLVEAAQRASLA